MILAGIDIGTNTLRLLIAEFCPDGRHRRIESKRHITRLGEDVSKTGRLKDEAMERSIGALEDFSKICSRYSINGVYAVATSAVRDASNGDDFIRMVKSRTGLDVDIISGDEEARLTMLGVSSGLDIGGKDVFLMDIGGGSTEFVFTSGGRILFKTSTDIGVVRFTEQYIHSDPPEDREIKQLEMAIEDRLEHVNPPPLNPLQRPIALAFGRNGYPGEGKSGGIAMFPPPLMGGGKGEGDKWEFSGESVNFIGTAGTVTTLAAIEQEMTVYDPDKINGYRISKKGIENIRSMLSRMTIKERKEVPAIEKGREDIIIAGAVVVDKVMEWFGFSEVIVSDNGLREGLVIDLYNRLSHASST